MHQRQVKVSGNIGPLHDEGVQLQPQRHWPQQISRTHGIAGAFRQCANRDQIPNALEISPSVAFSASLTFTPPPNRLPPSDAASAVF